MLVEKTSGMSSNIDTLSHQFGITAQLFDIISEQSDVDHPLCEVFFVIKVIFFVYYAF